MSRPITPVLAAVLAALLFGVAAAAGDEPVGELEVLRQAIEEHRDRVGAFEREERGLLETVEKMERAAEALADDAARARRAAREARSRLAELEQQGRVLEARLERTRAALARRAVALYKAGDLGAVRVLFSAESLPDALARVEALRRLLEHDRGLLERFRSEALALVEARSGARRAAETRSRAAERLALRETELSRERQARRAILSQVRGDRRRTRSALIELEAAARALEETLAHLQESPPSRRPSARGMAFSQLRGRLPAPVDSAVTAKFGRVLDAEFRTETVRKGVEFAAAAGTPIRAVADGEVRFSGWFRGYGKIVILGHGEEFFTIHGHLDTIDVESGEPITAGDRLGSVGETGSLTGPKLYFELRQGSQAVDPEGWLARGPGR